MMWRTGWRLVSGANSRRSADVWKIRHDVEDWMEASVGGEQQKIS